MRRLIVLISLAPLAACSTESAGPEPSLAYRPAEAIDPRVPVAENIVVGPVDPQLAGLLAAAVGKAEGGQPEFDSRAATARRLAPDAGPIASETWVAAQAALSRLVAQQGVATNAAADVDGYAGERLHNQRWLAPANQQAIADASARISAITTAQAAVIDGLKNQLSR